eukprot:TRINITY_DN6700_c1_g2_i1.p1 TRINITY_DN6700_c1_g2~~TRINITY_DN6700_c1_g2_i1.p1  ORF type:complete len:694 (-),score=94.56 TRINITY_DN6700_c1_g2_i1:867-2726(-)
MLYLEHFSVDLEQLQVVSSPALPVKWFGKEPAGHTFHKRALILKGVQGQSNSQEDEQQKDTSENSTEEAEDINLEGIEWKGKGKKRKSKKRGDDLYALLGLENLRWMATEKQLKDGYKKSALKCHPDKIGEGVSEEERERLEDKFKKMQEAFETLSDPVKRREYDSTDEFDDTLPVECAAKDFYLVFGAAFKRQSRWSMITPVPELGKDDTVYTDVEKFYDFWYKFKSWREFPHPDEEDVEQAECREHRRYIERYNAKLRQAGKKEEQKRLREFVENAYKLDPRILRRKLEIKQEKERKKREKQEAQRKIEEEKARKIAEEEARQKAIEEAEKAAQAQAKAEREAERKLLRKQRQQLRALCESIDFDQHDVETICQSLTREELEEINNKLALQNGKVSNTKIQVLQEALVQVSDKERKIAEERAVQAQAVTKAEKQNAKQDLQNKIKQMGEWSEEELRLLDKALKKFPMGTAKRWDQVTTYVRTRTQEEVLLMVKLRQGASSRLVQNQEDWRAARKGGKDLKRDNIPEPQDNVQQSLSSTQAAPAVNGSDIQRQDSSSSKDDWNKEQEMALVKALKAVGKDDSDRWQKIADLVPQKSKADCFKKFKEMRESFRQKKSTE